MERNIPFTKARNDKAYLSIGSILLVVTAAIQLYISFIQTSPTIYIEISFLVIFLNLSTATFLSLAYALKMENTDHRVGWFLILLGSVLTVVSLAFRRELITIILPRTLAVTLVTLDGIFIILAGILVFAYEYGQRKHNDRQTESEA